MTRFKFPKFHDRVSLLLGVVAGAWLVIDATTWLTVLSPHATLLYVGRVIQLCIGLALSIHCWDMFRYYRKHRIVRIVKTNVERIVCKQ